MKIYFVLVFLMLSFIANGKQQFYKWVDENGITHYSKKPPEEIESKTIRIKDKQPTQYQSDPSNPPPEEPATNEEPEKSYLEQRRERKQKSKELAEKNRKQCQKATYTIKRYSRQVRMSRMDPKTGETIYLDDKKREEIIRNAKAKQRKYC